MFRQIVRNAPLARASLRSRAVPASRVPLFAQASAQPSLVLQRRSASTASSADSSTSTPPPEERKGLKISWLFGGLVSAGLLVTIYGLLEWYYSLQVWPEPVRTPLRAALKAKAQGDAERADAYFRVAVTYARSIPPSALEPDPLLKLSGIYVTWAAMLEDAESGGAGPVRAFSALREAIAFFGPDPLSAQPKTTAGDDAWAGATPRDLSQEEQYRAIGLAQKLGQLAARMGEMPIPPPFPLFVEDEQVALPAAPAPPVPVPAPRHDNKEGDKADKVESEAEEAPQVYVAPVPAGLGAKATSWDSAAETYLSGALTAMLRIGLGSRPANATGPVVTGRDIVLPHDADPADKAGSGTEDDGAGRVNRRGLGMTMEALAAVYARQGRADLAAQLLVQAVSTVIPPQGSPSLEDRCQAAMLMTGVSSHALAPHTEQAIRASRSWSLKALQTADAAAQEAGWSGVPTEAAHATCARARTAAQFNLGMLDEIEKNPVSAARHFAAALATARDAAYLEGRREAAEALRRVRTQIERAKKE